jgi:hypothetical protein
VKPSQGISGETSGVVLYVGRCYEDKVHERFVIDGSVHIPENGRDFKEFHVIGRLQPDTVSNFEELSAPRKGRFTLSKNRKGTFWDNPNNKVPVSIKLYKKGGNILKGICSLINEKLCGKCIIFGDINNSVTN